MSKVIAIFVVFSLVITFGGALATIVSKNDPDSFTYDFETVLSRMSEVAKSYEPFPKFPYYNAGEVSPDEEQDFFESIANFFRYIWNLFHWAFECITWVVDGVIILFRFAACFFPTTSATTPPETVRTGGGGHSSGGRR